MPDLHPSAHDLIEIDFQEIPRKLVKHRKKIISIVATCVVLAAIFSFKQTPIYRATSRIMVDSQPPKIVKVEEVVLPDFADRPNFFNSQIEILKSHTLAELVFQDLGGYEPLDRRGKPANKLKPITTDERIEALLKQVKIAPVRMTQIIAVSVEDPDPKLAASIANKWSQAYVFFSSVDQLIQRRSELESDLSQQLKFLKKMHPVILGLQNQIQILNEKIDNERKRLSKQENVSYNSMSSSEITNVKILDRAQIPLKPVRPQKALNILLGLIFGGFFGFALVFLLESFDQTFKTASEIEKVLKISCLASIPLKNDNFPAEHVSSRIRDSGFAESFRGLRTRIIFSEPNLSKRTFVVTSASPGEGKTSVAVNLATVFAQANERVLLVDADMRNPRVHKVFKMKRSKGIADILANHKEDIESFIHETDIPGLEILTCGEVLSNPSELLSSKRLKDFINILLTRYDRIIFDTPPVLAATDAVVLATRVDTTILVISSDITTRQAAIRSKEALTSVHAPILGAVFNMVKMDMHGYDAYNYFYEANLQKQTEKKRFTVIKEGTSFILFLAAMMAAPLMYGSVHMTSQLIVSLLALLSFYFILMARPKALKSVMNSFLTMLGIGLFTFALCQLIPIPLNIIKFLSPAAHDIYNRYLPGGVQSKQLVTFSLYPSDTLRGILQFVLYALVYIITRLFLWTDEKDFPSVRTKILEQARYLKLSCLIGVLSLLFHSLYDFNLHIPANGMFFMFLLAIATGGPTENYDHVFFRRAVHFIVFFGFSMAVFAIVQSWLFNGHIFWVGMPAPHPVGSYYNYDHFAGFMELCSAVAVGMFFASFLYISFPSKRNKNKISWRNARELYVFLGYLLMASVMISTIFLSTSRGGIMSFLLSQIIFLFLIFIAEGEASRRAKTITAIATVIALSAVIVVWLGPQAFLERFHLLSIQNIVKMEGPINPRLAFYHDTLRVIKDFPIFGSGLNTFATNFTHYRTFDYTPNFLRYTHNDYLQLVSETGLAGMIFLFAFLFYFVSCTRRVVREIK